MPKAYLMFVLHAHLPYVRHPEYDRFLEERWLFEAITETYIPLIKFFDRMRAENVPFKLTLSVSPTLATMLEDPLLQQRYLNHINLTLRLAEREIERTRHWPDVSFLAEMYKRLFEEARDVFENRCGRKLCSVFKEFQDAGSLELMTCGATHGFFPAIGSVPASVRAQVFTAVSEHERIFGQKPKGMWLPECGYVRGVDEVLKEAGIRYFFTDSHGIDHADPKPQFGVYAPLYCPSGVAAFGRCPATSRLVWSSKVGYPGDPSYRDYYRDIGADLDQHYLQEFQYAPGVRNHTGIKYHRITGQTEHKQLYNPDNGRLTAERHASDFVTRCRESARRTGSRMPFPGTIISPYDAELFGHWWFEGPQWLYYVFRELRHCGEDLAPGTPAQYLEQHPVQQRAAPSPSTWGRNGYSEHWINPRTDWMWRPLHEAAERMQKTVRASRGRTLDPVDDRALRQAARELMLAQGSDWPFIITNATTEQYARRRFNDHLHRMHYLLQAFDSGRVDETKLSVIEYIDAIFPALDYQLFG